MNRYLNKQEQEEHEFEEFKNEKRQFLTPEMISDIIYKCINNISVAPQSNQHNSSLKIFYLTFENEEKANQFEKMFGNMIFKTINDYLTENNYNPEMFNRRLSTAFDGENGQRILSY